MRSRDEKGEERKAPNGVLAVRCEASGEIWVGLSPTLDKIRNRLWFMLRQNGSPHRSMQQAWNRHGVDAFAFEVLEEMPADVSPLARDRLLAERTEHWRGELGAEAI